MKRTQSRHTAHITLSGTFWKGLSSFVFAMALCIGMAAFTPQAASAKSAKPAVAKQASAKTNTKASSKASAKTTSKTAAKTASSKTAPKAVAKTKTAKPRRGSIHSLLPDSKRAELRARGINSGYGPRSVGRGEVRNHNGIDVSAPKGTKILAFNDGVVIFSGVKNGFGNTVVIKQIDGREALYAHMDKYVVSVGQQVVRGTHIGHVGRTGRATGHHVHFELTDNGTYLDPSRHVWDGSELVPGPNDLNPEAETQTRAAGPIQLHVY